jgi:hypothetical protein
MQARTPTNMARIHLPDFLLNRSSILEHGSRLLVEQHPLYSQLTDEDRVHNYMRWIGEYFLSASRPSRGPFDYHRHRVHDYLGFRLERLQTNLHRTLSFWWDSFTSHAAIPDPSDGSEDITDMLAAQMLEESNPELAMEPWGSDDQVT